MLEDRVLGVDLVTEVYELGAIAREAHRDGRATPLDADLTDSAKIVRSILVFLVISSIKRRGSGRCCV